MNASYHLVEQLSALIESIPPDSIVSRTFYKTDQLRAIAFGFDAGQELSEHTSSQTAIIEIVSGEATVTLGDDVHELGAGCWIAMPPHLRHSIRARTPLVMLLTMISSG